MSTNTKYDFSMFEDKSTDKYDFSMFDVKKKDFSQEELEAAKTSLQGYSEVPSQLEYEVPSTTVKEGAPGISVVSGEELRIEEKPTKEDLLAKRMTDKINEIYQQKGILSPEQKMTKFESQQKNIFDDFSKNAIKWQQEGMSPEEINKRYKDVVTSMMSGIGLVEKDGRIVVSEKDIEDYNKIIQDASDAVLNDLNNESRQELVDKYKDQGFWNEMWKALKVGTLSQVVSGVVGLKPLWEDTFFEYIEKPILKAQGKDEDYINAARESINLRNGGEVGAVRMINEAVMEKSAAIESTMKQYEQGITDDILDGNFGSATRQITKGVVESLPLMIGLGLTAGATAETTLGQKALASLATIGTVSASARYAQIKEQDLMPEAYAKQLANAWLYGGFEATGEIFTMGIFSNMYRALKGLSGDVVAKTSKDIAKSFSKEIFGEGVSEGFVTELGQQLTDYFQGNRDNIDFKQIMDATIVGSAAVAPMATVTSFADQLKASRIASIEDVKKVNENIADLNDLAAKKQELDVKEEVDVINEEIDNIVAENQEIFDKNIEIAKNLTQEEYNKVEEIDSRIAELDKDIAIKEEDGVSTKAEELLLEKLQQQRDDILTPKENIPEGVEARQISTEMVEPTKTIPEEKEALKQPEIEDVVDPVVKTEDSIKLANESENIEWYHGTKSDIDFSKENISPIENADPSSLVGMGFYTTANKSVAKKYAGSKGKMFKFKFKPDKVINGDSKITEDILNSYKENFTNEDVQVFWGDVIDKIINNNPDISLVDFHLKLLDEAQNSDVSSDSMIEKFQGVSISLLNKGYDGITHEGGKATNQETRHRVLVLLDPEGVYNTTKKNITTTKQLEDYAEESTQMRQEVTEEGIQREEQLGDMPERTEQEKAVTEEKEVELTPKDQFKQDFLSDEVNLNQIDVPLNMKERKAARKNLLEGKVTKQAQILEDYINKSFEKGNLDLVAIAAGGGTVRTQAPITSIVKGEIVTEPPTVEQPKVEKPKVEKITKEQVVPEIGVRKMGERVMKSKVLDKEFKTDLAEKGIKYAVRGRRVTDSEANEIAKIYKDSNDLNGLKSVILDKTNGIKGDTRTALAVGYYNEIKKLEDSTTDPVQKSKYKQDRVDIYYSEMNTSTDVAQDLQSKRRWVEITSDDPEVMKEANRRDVERRNGDFLEKNKGSIKNAKKLLDTIFESEEFKEDVEKKVKERFDKYVGSLKQSADRRARGQAKVASGLDKLASAIGAKKNLLTENQVDENIYKAVLEIADGLLDITVASTQDLINKIKSATREYLSQKDIDAIADKIIQDTDAANRIGKPVKKEFTDEDIKRIADKLKNKLEDLTPKQVRNILKDYIDEFERLGYVSDAAFNNIYAKALGKEYVSPQDEQLIEDAAKQINEAKKVKNNIETLFDELVNEENSENPDAKKIKELENEINRQAKIYKDEFQKAQIARKKLSNVLSDPRTVYGHIATILKLNLMAFTSFIVNWTANITSMAVRFPTYYMSNVLDYGAYSLGFTKERMLPKIDKSKYPSLYKIVDSLPDKKMTYDSLAFSKGFVKGFGEGARQSMIQMITGMLPEDLTGKDLYRSMQPIMAWVDNYNMLTGKKKAEAKEVILNLIEGTLGINPELAARILNMGDKPFREGGKRGRLEEIAKLKKLKGNEKKRFMMYPDPESLVDAEEMGKKMALQQENFITDLLDVIRKFGKKGADKIQNKFLRDQVNGLMYLIETIIQPFTKTPTNHLTEGFTFALPEISIALGTFKALSGDRRAATDYFARAIIGVALRRSVQTLIGIGIMSLAAGGEEDDPNKRSRLKNAAWEDRGSYTINWSAFDRYLQGEDPTWKDGDIKTSYQPFGIMSMVAMANAKAFEGSTQYEIEKQLEEKGYKGLLSDPIGVSGVTVRSALDQSFLKGQYGFMKALMEGGDESDKFTVQLTKELGAIIVPNWYTSIARWEDNYIREVKENYVEDGALKREIVNNYKVSFGISPEDLPAKLSIYGDDVNRFDNKSVWNIIDPFKTEKFNTGLGTELVELYRKTKNIGVIPQNPDDILNFEIFAGDEGKVAVRLSNKLYYEYAKPLIKAKISRIKAEMNGIDYELGNDIEKAELIEKINKSFMQSGEAKFIKEEFVMKNYDKLVELYDKQKKK